MSLPKFSSVMLLVLLLANVLMVAVSSVDPSDEQADDGAAQRIGRLHLEGHGSGKVTVAVHGDNLRIPRFATRAGTWHASADDLTPSARMSCDDDHDDADFASLLGGREHFNGLRFGKEPIVDGLVKLARAAATKLDVSLIMGNPEMEPADVWKIMSCAVLISKQNGGAWDSKEAKQLRSMGFFSKEDVLKQLGVIAWPNDCSEPIIMDRGSM